MCGHYSWSCAALLIPIEATPAAIGDYLHTLCLCELDCVSVLQLNSRGTQV